MQSLILGIFASILSAATALIIISTGSDAVNPLWLLLGQYIVGILLSPPRKKLVAALPLHAFRLLCGLWAFGAYYVALGMQGASAAEVSMILNTASIFATFYAVTQVRARFSAILACVGVAMFLFAKGTGFHFNLWQFLALSAAFAYAGSFIILGVLSNKGESPSTTNSIYNVSAGVVIVIFLFVYQPPLPTYWWPVFAVGGIAALRIQVLTMAAISPEASARVSVLTNLTFLWLALTEMIQGRIYNLMEWGALSLVMIGAVLSSNQNKRQTDSPIKSAEQAIQKERSS